MNDIRQIAIVDDHLMFRKGLVALVNLFPGYRVLFDAGDGAECIRLLEAGAQSGAAGGAGADAGAKALPDILLMDIAMPGMDGYTCTAWVRDHLPEIRVLALSTMDGETAIIKMIRSGARGYVLKDANPAELKKAFDDLLSLGFYYNDLVSRKIIRSVHLFAQDQIAAEAGDRLTDRETLFLQLICSERTYAEIAREMVVSERTVDRYRDGLFRKLHVGSRVGLVLYAIRNGIVKV